MVTGGAGYIGSQTVKELKDGGYNPIVFDNLSTGHEEAIKGVELVKGDLSKFEEISRALKDYQPDAVVHFAASIEVEESVKDPEKYFQNNIVNGLNLLRAMKENNIKKIIFSSSAAVYGDTEINPISENDPKKPMNPYGLTKMMFEKILESYAPAYGLKSISLRYFNAAGADPSGQMGQDKEKPSHLITRVLWTALGKYPKVEVYGTDYDTPDGTCLRDYIHIKDLAAAHVLALKALETGQFSPAYNLGTGKGYSVKEVIEMAKKVSGKDFVVENMPRRAGDPRELIASSALARQELGFEPKFSDLETIIQSAWNWHKNHPEGYGESSKSK